LCRSRVSDKKCEDKGEELVHNAEKMMPDPEQSESGTKEPKIY
jgi:hypothetical protein